MPEGATRPGRLYSGALDVILAAGFSNRWGCVLYRLKYALDPAAYRGALAKFETVAIEESRRRHWNDDELARVMAGFVFDGWLLDRQLIAKSEWIERSAILRSLLNDEEMTTAAAMIAALK